LKSRTTGIHPAPFLREAGLLGGRPWWRSRVAVCVGLIALALLVECIVYGWHLRLWGSVPMRSVPHIAEDLKAAQSPLLPAAVAVSQVLSASALLLPIWLTAKAWARDRDPSNIDQLRVLPVDHDSFTGAKLLWMQIFYAACLAAYFIRLPVQWLARLGDVHHSVLWFLNERMVGSSTEEIRRQMMPRTWFGQMEVLGEPWFIDFLVFILALSWTLAALGWVAFWALRVGPSLAAGAGLLILILPLVPWLLGRIGVSIAMSSNPFAWMIGPLGWVLGCLVFLPLAARREQRLFEPPDDDR